MATTNKTPRIGAAVKEFNIGKDTLVEFLSGKGFDINASNPNAKLTEAMYDALQSEFAQDKLAKRKSDAIALPKGSLLDNINKTKEELDLTAKEEKEAPASAKTETAPAAEEKSRKVEEPAVSKADEKAEVKEAPKAPVETPVVPEPKAIVEEKTAEAPVPEKKEPVAEEKPEKAEAPATPKVAEKTEEKEASADDPQQHIETKAPKLEGPKILDKINLDEMNLSSRPPKGAAKKKPEVAGKAAAEPKKTAKKEEKKKTEEEPAGTPDPAPVETPKAPEAPKKVEEAPATPPVTPSTPGEEKLEHIEMKAPKLEGPRIIGRIELPVEQPSGSHKDNKGKRERKKIPVGKKPENQKPNAGQQGQSANKSQFSNTNRPHGQQAQGGAGRNNDRSQKQGQYQGANRPGGHAGKRPFDKHNKTAAAQQPTEIDAKAIQDKIRETQAKLSGNTKAKNQKAKYRRDKREIMAEKRAAAEQAEQDKVIQVTEFISVSELAGLLDVGFADVISKCMGLGIMVSINQRLDAEVIELVAAEFGYDVSFINLEQEADMEEEEDDGLEDNETRAPIVTIMGHVDHGKTSLLDYIRNANVVAGEAGGITQHIGAYRVHTSTGKMITFLDTPGHEAFTAMRARGAKVADIAVIVIAADDAIMPQTKEAISHAQAANLPMIFAINKMDKEGANPEKIKEQLAQLNILVEDWGGKFQSQEISAKKGLNIDILLEKISLEAEMLELRANPEKFGSGSVIEASLDKGRGYVTTVLVQNGTLNQGEMIVSGQYYGKVKAMFNERGQRVQEAGPSTPVQVLGLSGAPQAGEKFRVYEDEVEAKEIAGKRAQILREQGIRARKHITLDEIGRRLALGNFKELSVIIKGDFDGSVEALSDSLQKLSTEEVAINVVHKGVGQITESDVNLATASDAILIGFQVRPSLQAARLAEQENIEIRTYSIIYDAIEEIKSAMEGLLEPKVEKKTVCNIEVREIYKISGVGTIAGCYVLDGKMTRNTKLNIIRDGIVVHTGELASLKRFKDDVKEVSAGYECGLSVKNYNDIRVNDIIEGYEEVEVKRTLN